MRANPFYYKESQGIRITVRPMYLRDQSEPSARHYVFAYFVRIENVSDTSAQLMSRRWLIHDSAGDDIEVKRIADRAGFLGAVQNRDRLD